MLRHASALLVLENAALARWTLFNVAHAFRRVACTASIVELGLLATAAGFAHAAVLQGKAFAALDSARSNDREALCVAGAALESAPGLISEAATGIFVPAAVLGSGTLDSVALVLDPYAGELLVGPLLSFVAHRVSALFLNAVAKLFIPSVIILAIFYKYDFIGAPSGASAGVYFAFSFVIGFIFVVNFVVVAAIDRLHNVDIAVAHAFTEGFVPAVALATRLPGGFPLVGDAVVCVLVVIVVFIALVTISCIL